MRPNVWVVVPVYNEETVVGDVIRDLLVNSYQVVAVDDCSSDGTFKVLKNSGAHVCRHPINLGQGAALQTGISYALKKGASFVVTFDADGQHTTSSIPALLKPLIKDEADITLGSRFADGGNAANITWQKKLFLKLALLETKLSTGLKLTDTHNGLRAMNAKAAQAINITQNRMAHASQILARIAEKKLRYTEVPVKVIYTSYSVQKGQKLSNAVNILWENLTEVLWR